jgi:(p)ppGpp synthase/HD superfamily hydrolase
METILTQRALEFANRAHEGQYRKFGDKVPYITHPIAVSRFADEIAIVEGKGELDREIVVIIALLHDTVEDTDVLLIDIEKLFSDQDDEFISRIVNGIDSLTKRYGENYLDAIKRVMLNSDAIIVKRADLKHNSSDLKEGSQKDKYRMASFILEGCTKH